MSAADLNPQLLLAEFEAAIPGIIATKYLSGECNRFPDINLDFTPSLSFTPMNVAAGVVVLLYDHLLLLPEEVCHKLAEACGPNPTDPPTDPLYMVGEKKLVKDTLYL